MRHFSFIPLVFLVLSTHAQITSTFDVDADGWTLTDNNNTDPQTVNYFSAGGNPGGYVSATKTSSGQPYFWTSPSKFGGNISYFSYGQDLTFDLQIDHVATIHGAAGDVQLRLASGSILALNLPTFPAQAPAWSSFTVRLDETAGWHVGSIGGPVATRAQLLQYLSGVGSFKINIKYNSSVSTFTGAIDNVVLNQRTIPAAPTISSFTPTSGKPGESIVLNGSDFDPTPSNNVVFFGAQAGIITSGNATSLTVSIPTGATYGKITVINKTTGRAKLSSQPFTPTFDDGGRIIPASLDAKFDFSLTGGYGGVSIADMDGDGWSDLVVARQDNTGIWVYRNLGTGGDLTAASFDAPINYPTTLSGTNGSGLQTIDFDNDGKLDMVTSGWTGGPGAFATFLNISTPGNLAFEAAELWNGRSDESPVYRAADIDGDGLPELIAGEGSGGAGQNVWITQNMSTPGNIEFGYAILYFPQTLDDAASGATIADLDNDGKPEFILVHNFGGQFSIIPNTSTPGSISFATGSAFTITTSVGGGINVADFNLDGKNDLAWKNGFSADDVHIRINTNSGGPLVAADFATEIILDSEVSTYGSVTLADINGDGRVDILATDNGDVGIFENVYTGGAFDASAFVPGYRHQGNGGSTYPAGALAGDLNGDNKPDIVVGIANTSPNRLSIYENKNTHTPVISLTTVSPLKGAVGSTVTITGDYFSTTAAENIVHFGAVQATVVNATKTELTVTVPAGASYAPVRVTRDQFTASYHLPFSTTFSSGVSFNNTHFAPPVSFTLTGGDYDINVADLNGDGMPDILAEANTNKVYAFRNTHTTGAISATSLIADDSITTGTMQNPRVIDLNGDNKPDFVATNGVFRNISAGSEINFEAQTNIGGVVTAAAADFNLDGKIDYVGTLASAAVTVFENRMRQGTGAFISGGNYNSISNNFDFAKPATGGGSVTADFDNDGLMDMACGNGTTDNMTVWRNNGSYRIGTTSFTSVGNLTTLDNPGRLYTGDMDVDGKVDIVLYYGAGTTSTQFSVFHNTSAIGNISFNRVDYSIPAAGTLAWISDLDGDGKPEILVTSETTNQFFILKNTSSPGVMNATSFGTPFSTAVPSPRGLATGDINLDGKPEIIINTNANTLLVFENLVSTTQNFITQWNLATAGSGGTQLTFGTATSGPVNYAWQEISPGTASGGGSWTGATLTITGLPAGATIRLEIAPANFQRIIIGSGTDSDRLTQIEQWGTTAWTSMQNAFRGCTNLQVTASDIPDLSGVTDMSSMFESCNNLNSPSNIGTWNTATVTNMTFMFYDATSFNQDIGAWNTSAVTNMSTMFSEALAFNQDIGSWNTAAVTDMSDMFGYAAAFNQDIGSWNTGAVTDMSFMFRQASAFNQDIGSWNTAAVTDMRSMFRLAVAFNQNIGAWTLNPTVDVRNIFDDSGTDCNNYSSTLIGWSANPSTPNGRTLGAIGRQYGTNAVAARTNLISTKGWTITGDTPSGIACGSLIPTIISFTPASGPIGTTVTITGTNFSPTPANNSVMFNGTTAVVSASTTTSITVTVPTGATTGLITVTVAGNTATSATNFTVTTGIGNAPVIISATTSTIINGTASIDLLPLLSDPDNNLDLSTLAIIVPPTSGASSAIDAFGVLQVNYSGISFSGIDQLTIGICDLTAICSQSVIEINVEGEIEIFNALSPNNDGSNDFFNIQYIEAVAPENRVTIYNRWGDVVWEGTDYNNSSVVFDGTSTDGKALPTATYFYKIEFSGGRESRTGFLSLKR